MSQCLIFINLYKSVAIGIAGRSKLTGIVSKTHVEWVRDAQQASITSNTSP